MRNVIKRIANIVFVVVVLLLAAYTFLMAKYPEETAQITGYRLYAVLTDSMEPRIPTFSLVCTKVLDPEEPLHLKKGDIITFKADRFGDDILLTHHFNKTEKDFQGNTIYRTNAEGKDNLDMYKTLRKDIVGTYVFHIPFIGKIFLFLKSKFGILLYAELAVIWLFNKTIRTRWAEKEQVLATAHAEAEKIRRQARQEADDLLKETNRKAEAIDQLAREQAISQARKMVQAATDETREIQNAHRLRLQDLKGRIAAMEQQRNKLMDFFSDMIGELQEAQDYARQNTPLASYDEDVTEVSAEPSLDLSEKTVNEAAAALPAGEDPDDKPNEAPVNCVVAPGLDEEEPAPQRAVELVPEETAPSTEPSSEYFDTPPQQDKEKASEEIEIPGAIFSYPILRQEGEPILDEAPPVQGPHAPELPDLSSTEEDEEEEDTGDIQIIPERKPAQDPRRGKAAAAVRALHRKLGDT